MCDQKKALVLEKMLKVFLLTCATVLRLQVSEVRLVIWCFEPSQPQRITSGLTGVGTGAKRVTADMIHNEV